MAYNIHLLVGKTIEKIEVMEYAESADEERVHEVIKFTCSDGTVLHFVADGGDGPQYATFNHETEFRDDGIPVINSCDDAKIITPYKDSSEIPNE